MEASKIIEIIQGFFGDRSRAIKETLEGLEEIETEVAGMIEALESDLEEGEE